MAEHYAAAAGLKVHRVAYRFVSVLRSAPPADNDGRRDAENGSQYQHVGQRVEYDAGVDSAIADSLQGGSTVSLNDDGAASFDPQLIAPNEELTIVVDGAQGRFRTTNWYITAVVTVLSGILAYFVSGHALKPLRSFASQVEKVQLNNLADMRIDEDAVSEFRQLSHSFNQMLERLNNAFAAQRQFTGNAAHELRTPLALMQAQLELFPAEHPEVLPETAEFLALLREQTERLTQMTKTLLEMSNLQQVARNEQIQLAPMIEEIFTDLAPLAEKNGITLKVEGDGSMTGSDALIYRLLFNLTENAVKYNSPGGSVQITVAQEPEKLLIRVSDTGRGIPEEYQRSIFQPFFRVDKSRSREYGGAGLGLSLTKRFAQSAFFVTIASLWCVECFRIWAIAASRLSTTATARI